MAGYDVTLWFVAACRRLRQSHFNRLSDFWEGLRADLEVSMESLILAQDERWRRA